MDVFAWLGSVFDTALPLSDIAARLLTAAGLSMIVGWEREARARPAGLRTHMLVGTGSATFIVIAVEMVARGTPTPNEVIFDPSRIIDGLIGGIGFLGAGSIIQSRGSIQGLTTAAGIWAVGGIGLACGLGHYAIACIVTLLVILILTVVGWAERSFTREK